MKFLSRKGEGPVAADQWNAGKRHIVRNALIVLGLVLLAGGGLAYWKAGAVLRKISSGEGGVFESVVRSMPGAESKLDGEADGRINVLLLGMRGENVVGGGLLADTVMILSIHPSSGEEGDSARASVVSVPRDLYVTVPGTSDMQKLNAVYYYGEERGMGQGIEYMKRIATDITGQPIHYAVAINFQGFEDLVDALGGVTVNLDEPFTESVQFHEKKVCDSTVFTVPVKPAEYEIKYYVRQDGSKYEVARYPLCYNNDEECGGIFTLPAGENRLDGETALCYVRSRATSSDFERAGRQQEVIKQIKEKALSLGFMADFSAIDGLLNSLGENVRTDMEGWEMKRFLDLYNGLGDVALSQKVLDTTEEGLLYFPDRERYPGAGSIILPIGDNYDRIRALFETLP